MARFRQKCGGGACEDEAQGRDEKRREENEDDTSLVHSLLDQNAILDGIRGSLAQLYRESRLGVEEGGGDGAGQTVVAIDDLPRVVDQYLTQEQSGTGEEDAPAQSARGTGADKESGYQELSDYIDRMLVVNNILAVEEAATALQENQAALTDQEEHAAPDGENAWNTGAQEQKDTDKVYAVRRYRNYAQGVVYSNFQISYDALLRGSVGLNEDADTINALYRSTAVAVFILLICALVDLMAFFAGLLLFKDVFLFERNRKLRELGYLNYEAALTHLFRVPEGGKERLLQLAFLYKLLYGDGRLQYPDADKCTSPDLLRDGGFQAMFDEMWEVLDRLGLGKEHEADLRLWLLSYVAKNGISFDEMFPQ